MADNTPSKSQRPLTKPPHQAWKAFLSCWGGCPRSSQNITAHCYGPRSPLEVAVKSLLLETPCMSVTGLRGPELELARLDGLSLRTSSHGTRRPQTSKGEQEYPATMKLSNWTSDLLNEREIMPGNRNLANYRRLVNSWISDENLQPPLF